MARRRRKRDVDISPKGWSRATDVLLYYPETLKKYAGFLEEATTRDPEFRGGSGKPLSPDPTADAAIRLAANKEAENARQQIEAVEMAIAPLMPIEREVIRRRFWDTPELTSIHTQKRIRKRPKQYELLQDLPYSERQMYRIVRRVVLSVAAYLGEW